MYIYPLHIHNLGNDHPKGEGSYLHQWLAKLLVLQGAKIKLKLKGKASTKKQMGLGMSRGIETSCCRPTPFNFTLLIHFDVHNSCW